jgi:hypothetical protein
VAHAFTVAHNVLGEIAAYLRQRQQWMRGAQSKPTKKSAPKGAKGASGGGGGGGEGLANALSNWIDERVVTTKSQWVSFQLERSRKQGPKKPATAGNEGNGAATLPAERLGVALWRPVSRSTFTTPAAAATERKSRASDGASEKHVVSGSMSTHQQPQHDATSAPWWQRSHGGVHNNAPPAAAWTAMCRSRRREDVLTLTCCVVYMMVAENYTIVISTGRQTPAW